ncbi:AAA family ATPase [Streptomyces anulatus]|uniref:AAA family ATPase n=1 Tax=Streptomyces anulatus TaxID=1892 RepID=UPI00386FD0C3|nr:AAA family ATPase [Streptomyces anulatus]
MAEIALGERVRTLNAEVLQVGYSASPQRAASVPDAPLIVADDPQIQQLMDLLRRYSGVLLSGPPGTSKSYLAAAVAKVMTEGNPDLLAFAQFHASYQYEDFMEGYRPSEVGGFTRLDGVFLRLCRNACDDPKRNYVMVIDELSRGDAGRIFGEALTYVERSKRGMPFTLPSGEIGIVPPNIFIIATMNPLDRGVDEVDAAFERRFAKLSLLPDADLLTQRLIANEVEDGPRERIVGWFKRINGQAKSVPAAALGHAYLWDITDASTAREAWEYQLQYHVDRAFRYEAKWRDELASAWAEVFAESGPEAE